MIITHREPGLHEVNAQFVARPQMSVFTVPFKILKVICLVALQYSKNAINTTISDISNITFIRIDFWRLQKILMYNTKI